jgi:hypothetical protein
MPHGVYTTYASAIIQAFVINAERFEMAYYFRFAGQIIRAMMGSACSHLGHSRYTKCDQDSRINGNLRHMMRPVCF